MLTINTVHRIITNDTSHCNLLTNKKVIVKYQRVSNSNIKLLVWVIN